MIPFRLGDQSLFLRLSALALILLLGGGYLAALVHLRDHVSKKDDRPAFSLDDLRGTYAGVDRPAALIAALDDRRHRSTYAKDLTPSEDQLLRDWLAGKIPASPGVSDRIDATYDNLPPGAPETHPMPQDVIEQRCVRCHQTGARAAADIVPAASLKKLAELKPYLYAKRLDPVTPEILAVSTHTHAPSLAFIALVAGGLVLATRFGRGVRHGLVFLLFFSLLLDFAGMWLARVAPFAVWLILVGGALFGLALLLALATAALECVLSPRAS